MITGGANQQQPITIDGDGVFEGAGSRWDGGTSTGTTFVCGDSTAGILLNGSGYCANFTVDANNVATTPFWRGTETDAGSFGTFMSIAVVNSAQDGWTIISSQNDSYYSCVSHGSARDNLYIDGGRAASTSTTGTISSCGR